MKNTFRALAFLCLAGGLAGAQTLTDGLTNYRVNGQAVASQYGFWKLQSITGSGFTWPSSQAYITVGTGKNIFPFNTNATLKIVDAVAANTETVALNSYSYSTSGLTLNTAASNPHASFYVTSGTCGLKEAMNDLGSSGTILVTQDFYNLGCTASTVTSITGGSAGLSIRDISYGNDVTYTWNGAAYVRGPSDGIIPFGPADVGGSASGNTTGTNGFTTIGTAAVPVMQVSTSATGTNTHTYVIDITKIASRSTAGKGAAITGGIDSRYETASEEDLMAVCQLGGVSANVSGAGLVRFSVLAGRGCQEIPLKSFDLTANADKGYSAGSRGQNERFRLKVWNGKVPDAWWDIKWANIFARRLFSARTK